VLALFAAALFSFNPFTPQAQTNDFTDAVAGIVISNPSSSVSAVLTVFTGLKNGDNSPASLGDKIKAAKAIAPNGGSYWTALATGIETIYTTHVAEFGSMIDMTDSLNIWIDGWGGGEDALVALVSKFSHNGTAAEFVESVQKIIASGSADSDIGGGKNAATAVALVLDSVQQFNTAIGQQFCDSAVHGVALNSLAGGGSRAAAGGATGSGDRSLAGFIKAYGGFGSQDNYSRHGNRYAGSDFGGAGVATGVGYKLSQELELGALFGYSWNHSEQKTPDGGTHSLGNVTDNTLRLGLYGNFTWDNLFVTSSPTFGIHLLNGERTVGANEKAKSDRTGFDFSLYNRAGYTFALPAEFFITPSYALGMTYLHDPEHREYGASPSVKYHDYDNWSLLQALEARVGRLFRVNDCFAILPEIWAGWEHEYLDSNDATTTTSFWGLPLTNQFKVQGVAQDRALLGVGLTTLIKDKYEVSARYDERLWDGGHLSMFTAGVNVKF
jgi:hypothetical protein